MNKDKIKQYIMISVSIIMVLCLLIVPIKLLSGYTSKSELEPTFTEFNKGYGFKFIFDNDTKIVYIFKDGSYDGGLCPYYLLDENDVPHMVKWENNEFVLLPNN